MRHCWSVMCVKGQHGLLLMRLTYSRSCGALSTNVTVLTRGTLRTNSRDLDSQVLASSHHMKQKIAVDSVS